MAINQTRVAWPSAARPCSRKANQTMPVPSAWACHSVAQLNVQVILLVIVGVLCTPQSVTAQQPAAQQGQPPVVAQQTQPQEAVVIELDGDVKHAPTGTSPLDRAAWNVVNLNDKYGSGTLLRTGLRSHVVLRFGDDTVVDVRRATLASIDQFHAGATQQTVRLGLGYGVIRGGSTEGTLRSDVVVDSAVATLAKRGTEGWEIDVAPYTGRFRISLARTGLVSALAKATGRRRGVRPGEYADQSNIMKMWVKQDIFDRQVKFFATEAVSPADRLASAKQLGGFDILGPGAGTEAAQFSRRNDPVFVRNQIQRRIQQAAQQVISRPPFVIRSEGNFGIAPTFGPVLDNLDLSSLRRLRPSRSAHLHTDAARPR